LSREDTAPGTPGLHLDEDPPPNELPPTRPFASDAPLPPHDSLPAEMVGERKTDRAPATLDGIQALLVQLIEEHHAGLAGVYEAIGNVVERVDLLERNTNERLDDVKRAAIAAGNGALEAAARVETLWQSTIQQASHEGERHEALRQSVTDIEQRTNHGGE
jgi:hypothetical protein